MFAIIEEHCNVVTSAPPPFPEGATTQKAAIFGIPTLLLKTHPYFYCYYCHLLTYALRFSSVYPSLSIVFTFLVPFSAWFMWDFWMLLNNLEHMTS